MDSQLAVKTAEDGAARWLGCHRSTSAGTSLACAATVIALLHCGAWAIAQEVPRQVHRQRSEHFILHSDMPDDSAKLLLIRMERVLDQLAQYWKRPLDTAVECFIVDDLACWPARTFPSPHARQTLKLIGGFTDEQRVNNKRTKAVLYAMNEPGIPEHELVHAYCLQAFGWSGPDWYKEGMAELAYHGWHTSRVSCSQRRLMSLRARTPSLTDVVRLKNLRVQTMNWLREQNTGDANSRLHMAQIESLRQAYDGSWAVCHFLFYHPEYRIGFRRYAVDVLDRSTDRSLFESLGTSRTEIQFEFQQFLTNVDYGYDLSRCTWNWNAPARVPTDHESHTVTIQADRGYQATGLRLKKGTRYSCRCTGTWSLSADTDSMSADGDPGGQGRLTAALYEGGSLSTPIPLGTCGEFVAPRDGRLYLRCQEKFSQLADNIGSMVVTLRVNANDQIADRNEGT